ncbi:uncharacterized protein [Procambarus clarkii]|uniref:uncharacterized protein n=1 Tax=Procambarus clarkii TaxID=6728 RepID=UPI0037432256
MKLLVIVMSCGLLAAVLGVKEEDARLIARRSTKTNVILTTTTTIVPLTCLRDPSALPCRRRRLRRYIPTGAVNDDAHLDQSPELSGTLPVQEGARGGRVAITLVTYVSSTYTVTSTSVNTAVTFSLSYYCSAPNAVVPPTCG